MVLRVNKYKILTTNFFFLLTIFSYPLLLNGGEPIQNNVYGKSADLPNIKKNENSIPVIEIRGEGKPMTAAQIRQLEEWTNGKPLDIKIEKTFVPEKCPRPAKRLDFVTFHYKGFLETKSRFDQTYGREKNGIRMQLGVGMTLPGLDKGIKGMCDTELRVIHVPYRLSHKKKSKVWKNIPNDEHWLKFSIEMLRVEEWTIEKQFDFMNLDKNNFITKDELIKWADKMRKEFGKGWSNEDIDNVVAARYYIKYFDVNRDKKIDLKEFKKVFERDLALMQMNHNLDSVKNNLTLIQKGRKRDPGFAWILDFNNDGIVSYQEMDSADQILERDPITLPDFLKDEL